MLDAADRRTTDPSAVEDGRATGIAWRQDGELRSASARHEIVLAAGAIGSPQILLRSGLGTGAVLHASASPSPDASITSGNTNAPTMMIAGKAAAMILADT